MPLMISTKPLSTSGSGNRYFVSKTKAAISETQKLFQTSGLSARNINLLTVPQLDTQPAVDIIFGGFDPD